MIGAIQIHTQYRQSQQGENRLTVRKDLRTWQMETRLPVPAVTERLWGLKVDFLILN